MPVDTISLETAEACAVLISRLGGCVELLRRLRKVRGFENVVDVRFSVNG